MFRLKALLFGASLGLLALASAAGASTGISDRPELSTPPDPHDTGDGSGERTVAPCDADANSDGFVNVLDLLDVILAWGTDDTGADIDRSGSVDASDIDMVLLAWGTSCP